MLTHARRLGFKCRLTETLKYPLQYYTSSGVPPKFAGVNGMPRRVKGQGLGGEAVSPGVGAGPGVSRTAPSEHLECLKKRMRMVKEIVISHYYRFYPPILVFDLALLDQYGECRIVAEILASELEMYGAYLGFLKYYFNAPYDIIEGDLNKNVETLKILRGQVR